MTVKKMLFIALVAITGIGAAMAYYQYNRPQQDVVKLRAQQVTAVNLFREFSTNELQANQTYLNKALQVTGKVLEVKQAQDKPLQIILDAGDPMFGIACTLDNGQTLVKAGDQVTIKGICTGYLNDVVLIRSLLLN